MEATDVARTVLAFEQEEKVARIFTKFDEDKDGVLRKVYSGGAITFLAPNLSCISFCPTIRFGGNVRTLVLQVISAQR